MPIIRKFHSEVEFEFIECECIGQFILDNKKDFQAGYRLYVGQDDVTENASKLASAEKLTMMRPALGPISLVTSIIIAAVTAVAIVALTPKVEAPSNAARSQSSSTNSFGNVTNEPAVNSRIDDIYGKVAKHVPRLMQVPHIRYNDNVKSQHFAVYIGQGRYLQENINFVRTPLQNIPNTSYNSWDPGGNPNNGTPPNLVVGEVINRPLVNVEKSAALSQTELLPPNDLNQENVTYLLTGNGSTATVQADDFFDGFDFRDSISAGDTINLQEIVYLDPEADVELWRTAVDSKFFENFSQIDLDGAYIVQSVSQFTLTLTIPFAPGDPRYTAWQAMSSYSPPSLFYTFSVNFTPILNRATFDEDIVNFTWYEDDTLTNPAITDTVTKSPQVGVPFDGTIGPFQAPQNVDTCVCNFVSTSGFYKLSKNNDVPISIDIQITIEETDEFGIPTGNVNTPVYSYESNPKNTTSPVGLTIDISSSLLYEYFRISARRLTDRDKSDNISNNDRCEWANLDFYFEIGAPDYGDVTVGQIVVEENTASVQTKELQFNLDVTRYIEPYQGNGVFGPSQPVETIAEVVTAIALDERNGRLTLDDIDADLYLSVQQQLISYYGSADYVKVGYDLDSTKLRFQDIYSLFWDAVNCRPYSQGAVYRVYPFIRRDDSSKQFTHRNKIIGNDSKDNIYSVENDGVEITYRSNDTGNFETIIYHVNGVSSNNRLKLELSGATQEIQAQTRALRELNILKYQRVNFSFEADGIARLTVPGERVDNVDNTRIVKRDDNTNTYSIYDGFVTNVDGLEVQLSQPVFFEPNESHTIRFTNTRGDLMAAVPCTPGMTDYHVILSQTPPEPIYTGYKMERTNFTFASDTSRLMLPVLVLGIKPKTTRGLRTRTLTGINYDDRYFQNDQDFAGS